MPCWWSSHSTCLCEAVEYVRCRPQPEGEDPICVELALPVEAQEVMVAGVDWADVECILDVHFSHGCMTSLGHDCVHCIMYRGIAQGEVCRAYAVVHAFSLAGKKGA